MCRENKFMMVTQYSWHRGGVLMLWLDYCSYRYLIDLEKQMYPKNA